MRIDDWRDAGHAEMAALYARERARWLVDLGWDSASTWALTETARSHGLMPGFVARDDRGAVLGWTFFGVRAGVLRIGALAGDRAEAVRELLDAVLASPEATLARRLHAFVFPTGRAAEAALERRRFSLERYLYLDRALSADDDVPPSTATEPFVDAHVPAAVRLLARAYAGSGAAECFAPNGRADEWAAYLGQLLLTPACGVFRPGESHVVAGPVPGGTIAGLVVVTEVGPGVAHVAQIVTDPAARRRGTASGLLRQVFSTAVRRGARRVTLLVAESNANARSLYAKLGFERRASFVFAARDRVTRVTARPAVPAAAAVDA